MIDKRKKKFIQDVESVIHSIQAGENSDYPDLVSVFMEAYDIEDTSAFSTDRFTFAVDADGVMSLLYADSSMWEFDISNFYDELTLEERKSHKLPMQLGASLVAEAVEGDSGNMFCPYCEKHENIQDYNTFISILEDAIECLAEGNISFELKESDEEEHGSDVLSISDEGFPLACQTYWFEVANLFHAYLCGNDELMDEMVERACWEWNDFYNNHLLTDCKACSKVKVKQN